MANAVFPRQMQVCRCSLCGLVCDAETTFGVRAKCPRCQTKLPGHPSRNLSLSGALLLASIILICARQYFPGDVHNAVRPWQRKYSPFRGYCILASGFVGDSGNHLCCQCDYSLPEISVPKCAADFICPKEPLGQTRTHKALSDHRMDWVLVNAGCGGGGRGEWPAPIPCDE